MDRVRAETLSDNVPDDMMVDMNFCVELEACIALNVAESWSSNDSA